MTPPCAQWKLSGSFSPTGRRPSPKLRDDLDFFCLFWLLINDQLMLAATDVAC